jgi:hypothetical protein
MAALSGETLAEPSGEFGVHPTMIRSWRRELVKRAAELFARGNKAPGRRGCAEGDRRSAPEGRTATGRERFSCREARHPPSAERRAMIALEAGLSVSRQCVLFGVARSSFYYRRRVRRLTRKLGLWAVRPKQNTSKPHPEHKVYPYLLRDKTIDQPNQVWAANITYIAMRLGFLYLVAIID